MKLLPLQKLERDRILGAIAAHHYLNDSAYNLYYKQQHDPDVRLRTAVRARAKSKGYWVTLDFYVPASWAVRWGIDEEGQTKNRDK